MAYTTAGARRSYHIGRDAHVCNLQGELWQPREAKRITEQRCGGLVTTEDHPDQACIEAVLNTLAVTGASILHVGVGNSKLAQRFAGRARLVDGLTVHQNEKIHADALGIPNYTVYVLNKHSQKFVSVITNTYDFVIDNNLSFFACCKYHFYVMIENYLWALTFEGRILTCQIGMDVCNDDLGWVMTYADLVSLESKFPVHVSKMTDVVYAIAKKP